MAAAYVILTELIVNAIPFVLPIQWLYGLSGYNPMAAAVWMQVLYGISAVTAALVVTHLSIKWIQGDLRRHIFVAATVVGVYVVGSAVWGSWAISEQGASLTEKWLLYATIHSLQLVGIFLIVAVLVRRRAQRASAIKTDT
jgi:hypothetical protein